MMTMRLALGALLVTAAVMFSAGDADAQLKGIKKAAEDKAAKTAVDKAVDKIAGTPEQHGTVVDSNAATPSAAGETAPAPAAAKVGAGAWANYDFTPGARILFADDFARDNVGDFPRRLGFKRGNAEVVEWQGARFVRATSQTELTIPLAEPLPEQFTMEFQYAGWYKEDIVIRFSDDRDATLVKLGGWGRGGLEGSGLTAISEWSREDMGKLFHGRIMADGPYVKVFINEVRVANVPNAKLGRSNSISIALHGHRNDPAFLGNVVVAAGGKKMYDAIAAEGRVALQGILFDTGSDRIRPESTPTLKEIGEMLRSHPDLKLRIEGHTDNVGQAASNQTLSQRRADAVRQHLLETFGVDGARLEAKGMGQTTPVAGNDTPEGRQQNRRVELVRL